MGGAPETDFIDDGLGFFEDEASRRKRDTDGLTEMQRRFAEAYTHDAFLNATKAAKLAGYSERTAYAIGHETAGETARESGD